MTYQRVNYDQIAAGYDQRFASHEPQGRGEALLRLAETLKADRVLEVGCGTGHWLEELHSLAPELYGLDPSMGMLSQAQGRRAPIELVRGYARRLPFESDFFDLAFCVNAIHHFADSQAFVGEAYRVLQDGGALAVVGSGPQGCKNSWYGYQYFEGTYETDLTRFPTWGTVSEWMVEEGFDGIELREVEQIEEFKHGREVLEDPFLRKNSCSQLALLSDEAYEAGLRQVEAVLAEAEERGEAIVFHSVISIEILTGRKGQYRS